METKKMSEEKIKKTSSKKTKSFEENLDEVDSIILKLENGELALDDSLKEFKKANKLLQNATKQLEKAEGIIKNIDLD